MIYKTRGPEPIGPRIKLSGPNGPQIPDDSYKRKTV